MNETVNERRAYSDRLEAQLVAASLEDKAEVLHALATGLSRCTELFTMKEGGEQLKLSQYEKGVVDAWKSTLHTIKDALDVLEKEQP